MALSRVKDVFCAVICLFARAIKTMMKNQIWWLPKEVVLLRLVSVLAGAEKGRNILSPNSLNNLHTKWCKRRPIANFPRELRG